MTTQGEAPVETGGRSPRRRGPRMAAEHLVLRLVGFAGIIGVGVALGAILTSNKVQGWIIGLVVALVSMVLGALSRRQR